jgi:hypothetical protein
MPSVNLVSCKHLISEDAGPYFRGECEALGVLCWAYKEGQKLEVLVPPCNYARAVLNEEEEEIKKIQRIERWSP